MEKLPLASPTNREVTRIKSQRYTGSVVLEQGSLGQCSLSPKCEGPFGCKHATTSLHRWFMMKECLVKFKQANGLTYLTFVDDDDGSLRLGWPGGEVLLNWYGMEFGLEFRQLSQKHYRSLREQFSRYWKRNKASSAYVKSRLKLQDFD